MMRIDINMPRNISKYNKPELFEVYVHDYDDSYHKECKTVDRDLEQAARSISSRPKRLRDYYEAMNIYHEYMDHLADVHGGKKMLKRMIKDGVLNEYLPAKPRLKNKFLRKLAKKGIHLSEPTTRYIDWDAVIEWADENLRPSGYTSHEVAVIDQKHNKKIDKIFKKSHNIKGTSRYKKGSYGSEVDYITEYFSLKNAMKEESNKKAKKDKNKVRPRLISDYIYGNYKDLEDTTPKDPLAQYNGILLSSENMETLAFYHKLGELGHDSYALMKRGNFNKRTLERFKQYRRVKKKDKKKNKKKAKSGYYEDECTIQIGSSFGNFMNDIAEENGYDDYEEFSLDMLDASWDNIKSQYQGQI